MSLRTNFPDSDHRYERCPLPKTHRRLCEAHLLWHQTLDKYHDPGAFRANLNAAIEALRNITFVLQNEKVVFAQFDDWYGPWQGRLKADAAAKWLHDARTTVVHQGELESHSTAEVRLITQRDEVFARLNVPVEMPSSLVFQNLDLFHLAETPRTAAPDMKDAAVAIERRWTTTDLGDLEVLETLARAYGLLSDIVLDAHVHLNRCECIAVENRHPDFRSVYHRTGTLECMATGAERRTQVFKLATGEELNPHVTSIEMTADVGDPAKRYGLERSALASWQKLDPVHFGERILYQAKRILAKDKFHQRMMFFRDGRGEWHTKALLARDRTEKHLLMRMAAQFVESKGCDAIVEVGEMWMAPVKSMRGLDLNEIQNAKGRGELLYVTVATREGISRRYLTPFTRGPLGGIKLGDTQRTDGKFDAYLEPVLEVWRRQGFVQLPDGKSMRKVWEPDAMDTCFCGVPKRFAGCCRPRIPADPSSRAEIGQALDASEFARAEELSRAALAQYVIWVKQHTASTMHVAQDFHREIVNIDVLALEELVTTMEDCLEANGNSDFFVPQVRHLAEIVGVPRLNMRLVALATHWLLKSGRVEEAILELDALGDLDKIDDAVALITAANVLDLSQEQRERLLIRASSVAADQSEKWRAQFALIEQLVNIGEKDKALSIVDSIIAESNGGAHTEARMLRWRITRTPADFQRFSDALDHDPNPDRCRYGAILIDEGMYAEAEESLKSDVISGNPRAKILLTDARVRNGREASARELFVSIKPEQVSKKLRYPYAVAAALVALSCQDEKIRRLAVQLLHDLPGSKTIDGAQKWLQGLESNTFPQANPADHDGTETT